LKERINVTVYQSSAENITITGNKIEATTQEGMYGPTKIISPLQIWLDNLLIVTGGKKITLNGII